MTESALETLLAKQAIAEAIYRYCRAMDRIDNDLANAVFHPGAAVRYGADIYAGPATGFVEMVSATHRGMVTSHHQVGNMLIEVDGDAACSETYITATLHQRQGDGALIEIRGLGRYLDRWERRDGRWAIADRVYIHSTDTLHPITQGPFAPDAKRDPSDLSYGYVGRG